MSTAHVCICNHAPFDLGCLCTMVYSASKELTLGYTLWCITECNPYIHLDLACEHAVRDSTTMVSLIYDGGLL